MQSPLAIYVDSASPDAVHPVIIRTDAEGRETIIEGCRLMSRMYPAEASSVELFQSNTEAVSLAQFAKSDISVLKLTRINVSKTFLDWDEETVRGISYCTT